MKKIFIVAVIALMSLTFACNRKTVFELTSDSVINVPYVGGNYTITYNLESKVDDVVNAITDDKNMITSIDTQTDGFVYITVSENLATETRETSIMLSYGNLCFNVDVEQEANPGEPETPVDPDPEEPDPEDPEDPVDPDPEEPDPEDPEDPVDPDPEEPDPEDPEDPVDPDPEEPDPEDPEDPTINIEADILMGNYYGDDLIGGLGHYWIILSDGGIVNGNLVPNSEFFRLDLLGPMATDESDIKIPDGYYTFDANNSFTEYTILNLGSSDYCYVDNNNEAWSTTLTSATLIVDGNIITLNATVNGQDYIVIYNDEYQLSYNPVSDIISTLESDYEINLNNATGTLYCYGDYWECGYCNWGIEFNYGIENGDFLVLDFLTDSKTDGSSGFEGTFVSSGFMEDDPTQPDWNAYTFIPGFRLDGSYMMGSIMQSYSNGVGVNEAPLFGGEFTITNNNDGTYTIIINATDDANPAHAITLNWTGELNRVQKKGLKNKIAINK